VTPLKAIAVLPLLLVIAAGIALFVALLGLAIGHAFDERGTCYAWVCDEFGKNGTRGAVVGLALGVVVGLWVAKLGWDGLAATGREDRESNQ
jgi:hypothetical protein